MAFKHSDYDCIISAKAESKFQNILPTGLQAGTNRMNPLIEDSRDISRSASSKMTTAPSVQHHEVTLVYRQSKSFVKTLKDGNW